MNTGMASAQGISELMSAENRASQIVAEARAGASLRARARPGGDPFHRPPRAARGERMKEAKREAEAVIGKVRAEKEAAFQSSSNEARGPRRRRRARARATGARAPTAAPRRRRTRTSSPT